MAEFLVRAKASDNPAASEVGDIIIVKPDGASWGKAECLPEYLVIKLPNISIDAVLKFQDALIDRTDAKNPTTKKRRKWHIPSAWIAAKVSDGVSVITINVTAQKQALINSVLEKV